MNGWITLHRKIQDHWIWQDAKNFQRWVDLIMMARWETSQAKTRFGKAKVMLQRGQLVTSIRTLMHRWKTSSKCVTDFLSDLENEDMIQCDPHKKYTVITICQYDLYQHNMDSGEEEEEPEPDSAVEERNRLRKERRVRAPIKQDNNNKNITTKNSSISSSAREKNLKFFNDLKNSEKEIGQAAASLKCEEKLVLEMLDDFFNEINFKETDHDSLSHFKKHFFDWARIYLQNNRNNGTGKQKAKSKRGGAETATNQYDPRRGTPAGDHSSQDYGKSF